MGALSLSAQDRFHLARAEQKYQLVRDRVIGIATGRHSGFFLGGRGGIGKSRTIVSALDEREIPFILSNTHITGKGLFDRLADYPDLIHLVEDVEDAVRDPQAMGVLKSALWGTRRNREGRLERLVTWNVAGEKAEFPFSGGIVMTSNLDLGKLPRLAALKTRISWMDLRVPDEEIAALMRKIALGGYPEKAIQLEPEQCMEVVEFIIQEAARLNRHLDLRLLTNSLEDRLQSEDFEAGCSWHDMVASRIRESPSVVEPIEPVPTRALKKARQLEIAREIVGLEPEERLRVWLERMRKENLGGDSRATLYRRLDELAQTDALAFES